MDRDLLLSKYENLPTDTKKTLDNNELTERNLTEHKWVIKELIG